MVSNINCFQYISAISYRVLRCVIVKTMNPYEIVTPDKSRGSWDHKLSLIQQISPDHLAARTVTTIRHVGAMNADLDLNLHRPARPRQSRSTQTNYGRGVKCRYDRKQMRRWKSRRPRLSSLSLSYKSRSLPPLQSLPASMTLKITCHSNQLQLERYM